jgi:hypothetical protein
LSTLLDISLKIMTLTFAQHTEQELEDVAIQKYNLIVISDYSIGIYKVETYVMFVSCYQQGKFSL